MEWKKAGRLRAPRIDAEGTEGERLAYDAGAADHGETEWQMSPLGALKKTEREPGEIARRAVRLCCDAVVLTLASPIIALWLIYRGARKALRVATKHIGVASTSGATDGAGGAGQGLSTRPPPGGGR